MELQAMIVQHLRGLSEPCNIQELAHGMRLLEPGDTVPERLRSTLTGMVRCQQVKRLHNGDGVLRYALAAMASAIPTQAAPIAGRPVDTPAASTAVDALPSPRRLHPATHRYETGVSARVLAALNASEAPIRRTVIESRLYPPMSTSQVVMALQSLRLKGKVVRHGTTSNATWSLAGTAIDSAPPAGHGPVRDALLQARHAIDVALLVLEA